MAHSGRRWSGRFARSFACWQRGLGWAAEEWSKKIPNPKGCIQRLVLCSPGGVMAAVFPGRYAAQIEGDFVVFLIGMRVNRLLLVHKWLPVATAMPRMLRELMQNKELGLLHVETFISGRTLMTLQYWRSFEQLHAYAHAREKKHLPAWAEFNRRVGNNG